MNYTELIQDAKEIQVLSASVVFMLLCVGLTASNQPQGIPVIVNYYIQQLESMEESIHWLEYTRNAMMKSIVLCGGPRVINAQITLYQHLPTEYQTQLRKVPLLEQTTGNLWDQRGLGFFNNVYGQESTDKEKNIKNSNADLWYWVKEVYGNIVGDMTYLTPIETELEVLVSLIQMDTEIQLNDHRQGLIRLGASPEMIETAEYIGHRIKKLNR